MRWRGGPVRARAEAVCLILGGGSLRDEGPIEGVTLIARGLWRGLATKALPWGGSAEALACAWVVGWRTLSEATMQMNLI